MSHRWGHIWGLVGNCVLVCGAVGRRRHKRSEATLPDTCDGFGPGLFWGPQGWECVNGARGGLEGSEVQGWALTRVFGNGTCGCRAGQPQANRAFPLIRWPMEISLGDTTRAMFAPLAHTHRTREPHQEGQGRAPNKEEGHSKAGEATRTAGTGNQNGADGRACTWEAATTKGMAWPASPVATGCQGNPCSIGIRCGVSPAAQTGCLRNKSGSPSGADQP